eukprot:CAMPEP_0196666080 /NCGR_PEP_ID=MMETSP1086-20130531/63780_1 /TAXON_ID=77921 /ORGANISM="Cyanoptyche  gloeocystis , Strain SAG4.97" /LENGTH=99 /DNA_ID=CAMNT_0042003145 /DNA_START=90 /DNA_END=385 /DNA_ORIENTATION=-
MLPCAEEESSKIRRLEQDQRLGRDGHGQRNSVSGCCNMRDGAEEGQERPDTWAGSGRPWTASQHLHCVESRPPAHRATLSGPGFREAAGGPENEEEGGG